MSAEGVLVTGATSGLGLNLCLRLLAQGQSVMATGRYLKMGTFLTQKGADFYPVDLTNKEELENLCYRAQTVFHCGAKSSAWGNADSFYQANVLGTQNIISGCLKAGVKRLVYVSTPSLYFNYTDRFNIKETDSLPPRFVNAYAHTKWLAEQAIQRAYRQNNLPVVTIRPRAIFGPYDRNLMPRLNRAAASGRFPLVRGGYKLVDVTYVDNVVDSLLLCAQAPAVYEGRIYNVTNGEPIQLRTLFENLWTALGRPFYPINIPYPIAFGAAWMMEKIAAARRYAQEPRLTRYGVGVLAHAQTLEITSIQEDLGYQPAVSLRDGIHQYALWLKENPL